MTLSSPTQLQAFLRSLGVYPKKGLSQNFLIDGNNLRKFIEKAELQPGESVLEIGPGPGVITEALLAKGCRVVAVEKDPLYAQALKRFSPLRVVEGDIMEFDLSSLPLHTKVVANLPFQLTAPILTRLVSQFPRFSKITVMVQEEVARRITALPKTREFGSLTLFLDFYATARYGFKISRHCFYPPPKVDAAVITLDLHPPPPVDAESFFQWVRPLFQVRRKMIKTTLRGAGELLEQLGERAEARPQDLSLENYLALFSKGGRGRGQEGHEVWID